MLQHPRGFQGDGDGDDVDDEDPLETSCVWWTLVSHVIEFMSPVGTDTYLLVSRSLGSWAEQNKRQSRRHDQRRCHSGERGSVCSSTVCRNRTVVVSLLLDPKAIKTRRLGISWYWYMMLSWLGMSQYWSCHDTGCPDTDVVTTWWFYFLKEWAAVCIVVLLFGNDLNPR